MRLYKLFKYYGLLVVKVAVVGIFISSCSSEVVILNGLNQSAANNVVLVLGLHDIIASKQVNKDNTYQILVKSRDQVNSLNVLKFNGLPDRQFSSLGVIFKKDSFISSPTEEQARFIYALQQQISRMILQISGVTSVDTNISLPPPTDDLWQTTALKPGASVLVKYQSSYHISLYLNRIRNLVANSVPGLTPDRVEVVFIADKSL